MLTFWVHIEVRFSGASLIISFDSIKVRLVGLICPKQRLAVAWNTYLSHSTSSFAVRCRTRSFAMPVRCSAASCALQPRD